LALAVPAYSVEGYVIVSADGMLANADHVMPDALKFEGDKHFFSTALDHADLIVHGRHSGEGQTNSAKRKRVILTRTVSSLARDPSNPKAVLWNPQGASFEDACGFAGVARGTVAIIGGPEVFGMFMDRFDTFWLSQAPRVRLPGGQGCFPGVPERTPQQILASHGLKAGARVTLDAAEEVSVTPWRRETAAYISP
jgi:dihydrofolate reductase